MGLITAVENVDTPGMTKKAEEEGAKQMAEQLKEQPSKDEESAEAKCQGPAQTMENRDACT